MWRLAGVQDCYPTIAVSDTQTWRTNVLEVSGVGFARDATVTAQLDGKISCCQSSLLVRLHLMGTDTIVYATKKKLKKLVNRGVCCSHRKPGR